MSSTLHEEPPVLPQSMSFWRRTFLYGKKVSSTLHEEPPVLPQSMSFWRRTFLYGKKVSSTLHEEPSVLPQFMPFWQRTFLCGKKVPSTGRGGDMLLCLKQTAFCPFTLSRCIRTFLSVVSQFPLHVPSLLFHISSGQRHPDTLPGILSLRPYKQSAVP